MNTAAPTIQTRGGSSVLRRLQILAGILGACTLLGLAVRPDWVWPALLVAVLYALGLSLGSLFFLALQQVCGARWSQGIEFIPRAMVAPLPWLALMLALVLVFGMPSIYEWSHLGHASGESLTGFKGWWLDRGFFWIRSAIYLGAWILFARLLAGPSAAARDAGGALRRRPRLAVGFLVVFALTLVPASFDWIMSIEHHWFSTIFGVYHFAGIFLGTLAAIALAAIVLRRRAGLRGEITTDHLHDLGRLIFAFSIFWGYIWFSQYMLIWYSNLPEETPYFALRHAGPWQPVALLSVICNWAGPFVLLLSRMAKRNESSMLQACILILIGRGLDLTLMILPPFSPGSGWIIIPAIGAVLAVAGVFLSFLSTSRDMPPTQWKSL